MNMYLFDGDAASCWSQDVDGDDIDDLDGTIDLDIVVHEYHHGVTFRLNPQWGGNEGGAMGEGGGDFFAYSINGNTMLGEYAAPPVGIREVNGKRYGDWYCEPGFFFCPVHTNGEIWANVLWDVRQRFIGDNVGGGEAYAINEVHQLYVNGIKMSPASPTMLEMRDAMLQDDLTRHSSLEAPGGSDNYCRMWEVFAGRGMGVNAQDTKDTGSNAVVENFEVPEGCQGVAGDPPDGDPTVLAATTFSFSQINLTWNDNSLNEFGFKIERCTGAANCTDFAQIDTVGADATSYSDTGLAGETTYRYQVRAFNAAGESSPSNKDFAETLAAPLPPTAPTGLNAVPTQTKKGRISSFNVELSWADNSNNEEKFVIERCYERGKKNKTCDFYWLTDTASGAEEYTDTYLAPGTYEFRVKASNGGGDSDYSNKVRLTLK
jgi:hypothetical protein